MTNVRKADVVDAGKLADHSVSESIFQTRVNGYFRENGWSWAHISDARRTHTKGLPDLLAFGGPATPEGGKEPARKVAIELKVGENTTTPEQRHWLAVLADAGFECFVLWPRHEAVADAIARGFTAEQVPEIAERLGVLSKKGRNVLYE